MSKATNRISSSLIVQVAIAILCITASFSFCIDKAFCMPVNYWREGGNNHGLTDLSGKEVVPALYPSIDYSGHGLFLLQERDPANWLQIREGKLLVNQNGARMDVKVPVGKVFDNILWLGKPCDQDPKFVPARLPADSLVVFKDGQAFGICDSNGKAILPFSLKKISHCSEGLTVIQDTNDKLFILNLKTSQIKELKLAVDNPEIVFSEGLASFQHERRTGFINTTGEIVIPPKYLYASPFVGGHACVSSPDSDGNAGPNAVIDKKGQIVSPSNLKISSFFGGYAVASGKDGKLGVVNSSFQFVVKPEFAILIPQRAEFYYGTNELTLDSAPPLFYYAVRTKGESPCVVSLKGDVAFKLPDKVLLPNYPPRVADGAIICNVWIDDNHQKEVYLDMLGKEIPRPFSKLSQNKAVSYRKIAPATLLKNDDCGDEYFNSKIPRSLSGMRFE
jgi:hypothetical protein